MIKSFIKFFTKVFEFSVGIFIFYYKVIISSIKHPGLFSYAYALDDFYYGILEVMHNEPRKSPLWNILYGGVLKEIHGTGNISDEDWATYWKISAKYNLVLGYDSPEKVYNIFKKELCGNEK